MNDLAPERVAYLTARRAELWKLTVYELMQIMIDRGNYPPEQIDKIYKRNGKTALIGRIMLDGGLPDGQDH